MLGQVKPPFRETFITFFPNRIVLTAVEAISIPLVAIPYLMPAIYAYTLGTRVAFTLAAPDGFIFALISISAISVLSALTAPYERRFDADVFKKREAFGLAKTENREERAEELSDEERALRDEQAERIRRMLRGEDKQDQ